MKVALAHYSDCGDISGVTTWLLDFCNHLVCNGIKVYVHLHHFGDELQQASILPPLTRLGVEVHSVKRIGNLLADSRQTLSFLNHVRPDIFLPQCLHAHYIAAAHAGLQGLPWIFTMHSDDVDYWCIAENLPPESFGGKTVCVSQYLARKLSETDLSLNPLVIASSVIPYGISPSQTHSSFSDNPFRVVYCGRLVEHQKRISLVIETLVQACTLSKNIEAYVIGDGSERQSCEKYVAESKLTSRIRFLGRVQPENVQALICQFHAILLMSDFEGLPVSLLEAMSAGVVPVARSIDSGVPELVHHQSTGLLVHGDPNEAAESLKLLSEDPHLWEILSMNARSLVHSKYTSLQSFFSYKTLIQDLVSSSTPQFPLGVDNLHTIIPSDARFQRQYVSSRESSESHKSNRLYKFARRLASKFFPF
jgi:colanic acid/amylovoran biosynthesis glycosyltransferase